MDEIVGKWIDEIVCVYVCERGKAYWIKEGEFEKGIDRIRGAFERDRDNLWVVENNWERESERDRKNE